MQNRLAAALLIAVSFIVIALGGYQCATHVTDVGRKVIPIDDPSPEDIAAVKPGADQKNSEEELLRAALPESEARCSRSKYSDLEDKHGSMASFKIRSAGIQDYRFGESLNFELKCPRIYLDMDALSSKSRFFKGTLTISYETSQGIHIQKYSSGSSDNDNKYNRWTRGSWNPDSRDQVGRDFNAIFQNKYNAVILRLEDVRVQNRGDGDEVYLGSGEVYYKMFRLYTRNGDSCYNEGAYAHQAKKPLDKRNLKCWLIGAGPLSCRPEGALAPRAKVTDINITGRLPCYNLLGDFGRLDIKEAFNVGDVRDIR